MHTYLKEDDNATQISLKIKTKEIFSQYHYENGNGYWDKKKKKRQLAQQCQGWETLG